MSNFTTKEIEYLTTQRLGRLATTNAKGQPQVTPVGFHYNPDLDVIEIGGRYMSQSKKFRNVQQNPHVSFVVDDVLPPWKPRGVEIRGIAEVVADGAQQIFNFGSNYTVDSAFIRIKPTQIIGWGIESEDYQQNNRKVAQK
jgi:pyridoxamine 5'-phosphate oxidase family protein